MARPRGRPRQFDPDQALKEARALFWRRGFAASSLDDLSAAMGINRPSLYAAFGDKEALYRAALVQFSGEMKANAQAILERQLPPREALRAFYQGAIAIYTASDQPLGCFVFASAITECPDHPSVRELVSELMGQIDALFAQLVGEEHAALAATILHGLSARARAGTPRVALEAIAEQAIKCLFTR